MPAPEHDTSSEAYKLECLARHVAKLPTQSARTVWLAEYENLHGRDAAAKLRELARIEYGKLTRKKIGTVDTR